MSQECVQFCIYCNCELSEYDDLDFNICLSCSIEINKDPDVYINDFVEEITSELK